MPAACVSPARRQAATRRRMIGFATPGSMSRLRTCVPSILGPLRSKHQPVDALLKLTFPAGKEPELTANLFQLQQQTFPVASLAPR